MLTELSLTVSIDDCLIEGENIEEVMAQLEDFLDICQVHDTKLKQERCVGKIPSEWMDIEASHWDSDLDMEDILNNPENDSLLDLHGLMNLLDLLDIKTTQSQ